MPVSEPMLAQIQAIYRYPVKGLTPEPLPSTDLAVGETVPGDRLYAIENGPSGFDPAAPRHQPKARYLMLMRNERLATLSARLEPVDHVLTIEHGGREAVRATSKARKGAPRSRRSSRSSAPTTCAGRRRSCTRPATAFPTWPARSSRSSISPRSRHWRMPSARRSIRCAFAAMSMSSGWPAWHEFALLGREIAIGKDARLKVVKRIVRCAATNVDPDTGIRDLAIPETLERAFGHADCGVYAEVVGAGRIAVGDAVRG